MRPALFLVVATFLNGCAPAVSPTETAGGSGGSPGAQSADSSPGISLPPPPTPEPASDPRIADLLRIDLTALPPGAFRTIALGVRERTLLRSEAFRDAAAKAASITVEAQDIDRRASEIRARLDELRRHREIGAALVTGTGALVSGALAASSAAIPGVGTAIAASAASSAMGATMGRVLDRFEEAAAASADRVLSNGLAGLSGPLRDEWERASRLPPRQAFDAAFALSGRISDTLLEGIDGAEREVARATVSAFLARQALAEVARQGSLVRYFNGRSSELSKSEAGDLIGVARSLQGYGGVIEERLGHIVELQERILDTVSGSAADISLVNSRTEVMAGQVQFISDYLFSTLGPDEQLAALRSGAYGAGNGTEREALETRLILIRDKKRLIETVGSVVEGAEALVDLAERLGVNPDVVRDARRLVGVVSAPFVLGAALAGGGGVVAVAEAVGNLFGVLGPDVAAVRHREVLERLEQLAAGQEEILRLQRLSLEAQLDLMNGQRRILDGLSRLSERVNSLEDELRGDLLINRAAVMSVVTREALRCEEFLLEATDARPTGYAAVRSFVIERGESLGVCVNGLEAQFKAPSLARVSLGARYYESVDARWDSIERDFYRPMLAGMKADAVRRFGHDGGAALAVALSAGARTFKGVQGLLDSVDGEKIQSLRSLPFDPQRLDDLLHPEAVVRFGTYALEVAPFLDLADVNRNTPTIPLLEQVLGGAAAFESQSGRARRLIEAVLRATQLTIAQQVILRGFGRYHAFETERLHGQAPEAVERARRLGATERELGTYALHALHWGILLGGRSYQDYDYLGTALGLGDPTPELSYQEKARRLFGRDWGFHYGYRNWAVYVGGRSVDLPRDAFAFVRTPIDYGRLMDQLLQLRTRLAATLAERDLARSLPESDRRVLAYLLATGG